MAKKWETIQLYIHIGPSKTTRFVIYDMKPPTFTIAYHRLNIQLCSWPLLSKQKKIRGFRKWKVHCCNFKGFKVTNLKVWLLRDSNPRPPHEPLVIGKLAHAGVPGSNPGEAQLWRLVTLKLQQCTLHFWKPLIFFCLDKRGQGHSYFLSKKPFSIYQVSLKSL